MNEGGAPSTFKDAMEWIGARGGLYAMKVEERGVVVVVTVGASRAVEVAASFEKWELEAALLRAVGVLATRGS